MKSLFIAFYIILSCFFLSVCFSIFYLYAEPKIDEIIFAISNQTENTTNSVLLSNCLPFCISILFLSVVFFSFYYCAIKFNKLRLLALVITFINMLCILYCYYKLGVDEYLNSDNSSFVSENYYPIKYEDIVFPSSKKNIIRIIVESMEVTYAGKKNGGNEEHNLIPELTKLHNESFSGKTSLLNGAYIPYGTTWTMGSIFAQETGVSLETDFSVNDNNDEYIFNLISLGKVLKHNGYNNYVMRGSDTSFSNANDFYKSFGDYTVYDYVYAKEHHLLPDNYSVWWGYEDEKLFSFAKLKLTELYKNNELFNFTIVTADTHSSDGYFCRLCKNEHSMQYKNVISCSSRQIADFVEWIKNQEFYKDTVIEVIGDHLTMDKNYTLTIDKQYERKGYINIINSNKVRNSNRYREYSLFDMFPTILSSMGAEIKGNKIGFGVDLYSEQETLVEKYGFKKFNDLLKGIDVDVDNNFKDDNTDILIQNVMKSKSADEFFENYAKINSETKFVSFLVSQGNISALLNTPSIVLGLKKVGLELNTKVSNTDLSDVSLIAIFDGGHVYDFIVGKGKPSELNKVIDGQPFYLFSSVDNNLSSIKIHTDELSRQCNGLNFVVFDLVKHDGVFSICLD